jgi:hypothetical protein
VRWHLTPAAEKVPNSLVILSEAKNLSFFSRGQEQERFFASLRMTKFTTCSETGESQPILAALSRGPGI